MAEKILKISSELFDSVAREWAEKIASGYPSMKKNQIRNFYDKVLELYEKSQYSDNFEEEVLPFVKMLNSKVAYALNRSPKVANSEFKEMMESCIREVETKKDLEVFKYFFEAVIGFYKGGN
ncbi:MAG: type III-A CRISPR-associated protein Csm2 [Nautiliaceae bacterium]|jgi:CRISPR-associated protein Csm2